MRVNEINKRERDYRYMKKLAQLSLSAVVIICCGFAFNATSKSGVGVQVSDAQASTICGGDCGSASKSCPSAGGCASGTIYYSSGDDGTKPANYQNMACGNTFGNGACDNAYLGTAVCGG